MNPVLDTITYLSGLYIIIGLINGLKFTFKTIFDFEKIKIIVELLTKINALNPQYPLLHFIGSGILLNSVLWPKTLYFSLAYAFNKIPADEIFDKDESNEDKPVD
ncbi:MAG: hypothetical protein IAE91_10940 [Ignavibacteriaceae bacterium]|nr:hypothetical protein [Ignavibacteriaceae bacterium]